MPILEDLLDVRVHGPLSELLEKWWRTKVLIVADTIVSLGPEQHPNNMNESYFGMGHLLSVLGGVAWVTKAHRGTDPLGAPSVIANFRFDQHDLSAYDQIWLLGYGSGVLPVPEQAAIAAFMNAGGGLFATGDHATLGSALAGQLPRVRSMRRWNAPPPLGPTRVDTTQPDANNIVVFENQSDDIPQKLLLKFYSWREGAIRREVYPHPVLCSRWGPIEVFPDHMHEGEVVDPAKLDEVMTLGSLTFDEYPKNAGGDRVAPQIVAWGKSTGRASPEVMSDVHVGADDPSNVRWTGAVGVYDGRQCGVGRVVVDSTWHHFFDINLIGDNAANRASVTDPRKPIWQKGFTYSPQGQAALDRIDDYFRNIVRWLSPGAGSFNHFNAVVAQIALNHQVREVLETTHLSPLELGAYAWEHAVRYAPPCTLTEWMLEPILEIIEIPVFPWDPDPGPLEPGDIRSRGWPAPLRQTAQTALGGALLAFAGLDSVKALQDEGGDQTLRDGARKAVHGYVRQEVAYNQARAESLSALDKRLDRRATGA